MSQSPENAVRRTRYEEGWEAINRMIREDGSWSGRERNCLLAGCDDGTFTDVSAASGIDFIEDGRAFAVLDHDGDGDLDILLRSRNGPRLRVLRNRLDAQAIDARARAVAFHLTGVKSNRDAVGARIEMETASGRRVKTVEIGSGFLSQHSRWLTFGLGEGAKILAARVRWAGGRVQELTGILPGRRYRIVEGEPPAAEEFRAAPDPRELMTVLPAEPPQASPAAHVWLIDPIEPPNFALRDLSGKEHRVSAYRGRPLLLLFLSSECGACAAEVEELKRGIRDVRAAGAEVLGIAIEKPGHTEAVLSRFGSAPFSVLRADDATATAWNTLHRALFNRQRNLAVPTSFLIGGDGRIEKVYRGGASAAEFAADARRLPIAEADRLRLALPFPGRLLGPAFRRDLFLLGASYTESGSSEAAARALEAALAAGEAAGAGDPEAHYNLGVALAAAGDAAGAARAYGEALRLKPGLVEAMNNLGILDARAGRIESARDLFLRALSEQPGHVESILNLARTFLAEGGTAGAIELYRGALREDPESVPLWRSLGYALYLKGDVGEGISAYRRALAVAPADADASEGLCNLLLARGGKEDLPEARRIAEEGVKRHPGNAGLWNALGLVRGVFEDFGGAEDAFRRAIAEEPKNDGPYLNLARLRRKFNDRTGAIQALRDLLTVHPEHPGARKLLGEMGSKHE